MINSRRALYPVFAGLFVAASLGIGRLSGKENGHSRPEQRRMTARAPAPPASKDSLSDYDFAAGEDFLVSATPAHLAKVQTATGGDRNSTGNAEDTDRNAAAYHPQAAAHRSAVGVFSDSLYPGPGVRG